MNDIQILKAVKKRERGSRLLYYADFTDACWENVAKSYGTKKDREEFCIERGFFISKVLFPKRRDDAPKLDFSQYFRDIKIPEGVKPDPEGMLMMPGSTYHFTHLISPLRNIYDFDEIRRFPIYRRKEHFDFSHYKRVVEESHARGQTVKAWAGRFFETAWPLRGYENMLADMIVEPETAEYFLDIETDFNKAKVTAAAEAGA
ncbi:MAG: hypothetical protein FWE84_06675, partial [Firmicutes bacterium]|nr:hypothetical protein [Bacillota bacterium]